MEFIGLLIDRINDELVVLNNSLTDRELTTDFYLREYDLLFNKIILMKLNINNGIVITINDINVICQLIESIIINIPKNVHTDVIICVIL